MNTVLDLEPKTIDLKERMRELIDTAAELFRDHWRLIQGERTLSTIDGPSAMIYARNGKSSIRWRAPGAAEDSTLTEEHSIIAMVIIARDGARYEVTWNTEAETLTIWSQSVYDGGRTGFMLVSEDNIAFTKVYDAVPRPMSLM